MAEARAGLARVGRLFGGLRPAGKALAGLGATIIVAALGLYAFVLLSPVASGGETRWEGGSLLIDRPKDYRGSERCTVTPDNGAARVLTPGRLRITLTGTDSRVQPWFDGGATVQCESTRRYGGSRAGVYTGSMADLRAFYATGLYDFGLGLAGIVPLVIGLRLRKPQPPAPPVPPTPAGPAGPPGWGPPPA